MPALPASDWSRCGGCARQFAEPCIIECHDGEEECNACITKSGGSHEVHAMHAANAINKPFNV
eukprot:6423020-Pyramimonas_sp.AAC.1